jgi:hypothetical protein
MKRVVLGAVVALSVPAWAYRPFDFTDADVAAPGEVELELQPIGYLHAADGNSLVVPAATLNIGLRDDWEIVVEGTHRRALRASSGESRSHVEDTGLSFKKILRAGALQDAPGTSVAIELGTLLPTLHGESGVGAAALLVASHHWPGVTAHLNGEAALSRAGHAQYAAGVILEGRMSGPFRPVMEWVVESESGHSLTARSLLLGAIWDASESLSFDVGGRIGRADGRSEYEIRAGLTWHSTVTE